MENTTKKSSWIKIAVWSIVVALLLCGGAYLYTHIQKSPKRYKVGDYYNVNGKEGVVFEVWNDGLNGKIVSLDQTSLPWCTYEQFKKNIEIGASSETDGYINTLFIINREDCKEYPAFVWCREHGDEWYMPAIEELKLLIFNDRVRNSVNKTLKKLGATELYTPENYAYYWSSTENTSYMALGVFTSSNSHRSEYLEKCNINESLLYLRAICRF